MQGFQTTDRGRTSSWIWKIQYKLIFLMSWHYFFHLLIILKLVHPQICINSNIARYPRLTNLCADMPPNNKTNFNLTSKPNTLHEMRQLKPKAHCAVPVHHPPLETWLQLGMIEPRASQVFPIENLWHFPTCTASLYLHRNHNSTFKDKKHANLRQFQASLQTICSWH